MTTGTVVGKDCQNHAQITYVFEVGGQTYTGARSMGEICASAVKGQHIDIYYNTLDPAENTPYKPSGELNNEVNSIIAAGVFLSSFVIWRISKLWSFGKA